MTTNKISRRRAIQSALMLPAFTACAGKNFNGGQTTAPQQSCYFGADSFEYRPVPAQVPATEGVLPLNEGAGLYYWDTGGDGPVLVLTHPGTGSALVWPYQQPVFAAAGYRVIAYSRRGHFGSPGGNPNAPGSYAGDLHALVEHLGIERFHLLGIAAGGFTVTDYAVSYPERLLSFTIACSQLGWWDEAIASGLRGVLTENFLELPPDFQELGPSYRGAYPQGVQAWLALEKKAHRDDRVRQSAMSEVNWQNLERVPARKLLIAGGADLIQPPSLMRMAARHLTCESIVIPEAGHAPQWERPDLFNRIVLDFIGKSG